MFKFPFFPGWKDNTTSKMAAHDVSSKAEALRERVYLAIYHCEGRTTHQLAELLNEPYSNVQPRTSELYAQGKIKPADKYGKTPSGRSCKIWVAV